MNFASVVSCLQYLKIHNPTVVPNAGVETVLASLGLTRSSPVCDVESSTEEHIERLDWTEYRKRPGWDDQLTQAYNRSGGSGGHIFTYV